jgi:hypothetical protein
MNTSPPSGFLKEIDRVKELRDHTSADIVPGEHGCDEQNFRVNPVGRGAPGEDNFETFVAGAGI